MNRAFLVLVLGVALALAACSDDEPAAYQGYVEGEYVRVGVPGAGTLMRLAVKRGDGVKPGDLLFELDCTAESAARDRASARLRQAKAQLEDLTKGKRPAEVDVVEAQKRQAEADLALAEVRLARQQRLYAARATSKEALDRAQSDLDRERARVAELAAQLETTKLAAREDLIRAAESAVAMAEAALAEAQWQLDQRTARAPAAALVFDTLYVEGEFVPAGSPVVSLLPPGNVKIRFFVPEPELAGLRLGQRVRLGCDGCTGDLEAEIRYISPEAEYTPPVIFSRESRSKLVYLIEAWPLAGAERLHVGQPLDVTPVATP
ncbi:MAG TPA: HlyD family efflux transporter periplasmic adaptor subunit [Alphaproteobacteria bacterium]